MGLEVETFLSVQVKHITQCKTSGKVFGILWNAGEKNFSISDTKRGNKYVSMKLGLVFFEIRNTLSFCIL